MMRSDSLDLSQPSLSIAPLLIWCYTCTVVAELPCGIYELSLPIDMWDGVLTHVYYSRLNSTVTMEE